MTLAAVALSVELLQFSPQSVRTTGMFRALAGAAPAAGLQLTASQEYQGGSDWLLLWGPGAPNRFEPMRRQVASGGHVLALDAAYWQRDTKVRVSIDAAHPQRWVMKRDWPSSRFDADHVAVTNDWNPNGPVIVAGLGDKARVQYGADVIDAWEADMVAECRRRGWTVQYRAKRGSGPIDQLRGAALIVTWHSNVAVDAIRMGIPVVCRDGAAAAVCPSVIHDQPQPMPPALRDRFLANLAFWQWAPSEAAACWAWLREVLA